MWGRARGKATAPGPTQGEQGSPFGYQHLTRTPLSKSRLSGELSTHGMRGMRAPPRKRMDGGSTALPTWAVSPTPTPHTTCGCPEGHGNKGEGEGDGQETNSVKRSHVPGAAPSRGHKMAVSSVSPSPSLANIPKGMGGSHHLYFKMRKAGS